MSEIVITKDMSKEDRLKQIKIIHQKRLKRQAFRARLEANAQKVRRYTDEVEKPARKKAAAKLDAIMDKYDENYNHYTDASKYAKEYYGERMYQTTRFDNDWD